ncbi:endonuclease/exonuclease/phosphatase family protein [Candidatus Daviesbacteria bacterium]|nr:endonuclease/exonuclease/phosphatase family protein [Candidatus Daviesbacteria bacterium]
MKLISLNTWGGKYFEPLANFIKQHSKDSDIFCFQEIYNTRSNIKQYKNIIMTNLLNELKDILTDFQVFYFPILSGFDDQADPVTFDLTCGLAIFIKKNIRIISYKDYFIYQDPSFTALKKDFSNLATPLQQISFNLKGKTISVFNFHGTPFPADKLDSPNRLEEAEKVKDIVAKSADGKILVGDFNLLPQTECIKIIGQNMRNLIEEFNIERTRSNLSPYFKKPHFQLFADYVFVTSDVEIKDFQVQEVEISDHLPMILAFD